MKPKKMCDEAVDDCLKALKFAPDWFATSKMLERSDDALNANDDLLFFDKDFSKLTFFANQMDILGVDLIKLTLMKIIIFMKMILIPLFMSYFWLGIINLKNTELLT